MSTPFSNLIFPLKSSFKIHLQLPSNVSGLLVFPSILFLYASQSPKSSEPRIRANTAIKEGRGIGGVKGRVMRGAEAREGGRVVLAEEVNSVKSFML